MTVDSLLDVFRGAVWLVVVITVVITVPGLLIGLIVSIFQAATQINEQTLSFLPRLMITLITLAVAGPWLAHLLYEFTQKLFLDIPTLIG